MSYKDDVDGRAEADRSDAETPDDGSVETDAAAEVEATVEAAADADSVEDSSPEADAGASICPDTLPGDGPVHLRLRWRSIVADEWNDLGSAALAVDGGVVLAAIPRSPAGGDAPRLVRLSAVDGSPLLDGPDELADLGGTTALAAVADGTDRTLLVAGPGVGATRGVLLSRLLSSGALRELGPRDVDVGAETVTDLRAAQDGERAYVTVGGYGDWRWTLRAVVVPLGVDPSPDSWDLEERPRTGSGAFVAACRATYSDPTTAWTSPSRIELRSPEGWSLAGHFLPTGSTFVPIAPVVDPELGSCDYLLAGRGDDEVVGVGMWVVRRGSRLDLVAEHWFVDFESLADQPDPRALEPAGSLFVLAWTARRDLGDGPVPSCLYLTPVDADGNAAGSTLRIDPGETAARPSGIGHVRLVVGADGVFVLWREAADVLLARVDLSS